MNEKIGKLASKILGKSLDKTTERERRVLRAVVEHLHISRPIQREIEEGLSAGQRLADRTAAFGGSWTFIIIFFSVLAVWMGVNAWLLAGRAFDPYPFILLNLVLSCLAAVQAPLILMSQNRQAMKDRIEAAHDYEVNLKAEIEIMQLHEKLEAIRAQDLARALELLERQAALVEQLVGRREPQ